MHPFETLTSRTKKTAVLINVFIWICKFKFISWLKANKVEIKL